MYDDLAISGPRFEDRAEAGRALAGQLSAYRGSDALLLAIPRGGVAVASEVAKELGLELDVVVARKLGAPGQQELAIGAVTADGERYLDPELIRALRVSDIYIANATRVQTGEARRRETRFRASDPPPALVARTVIIVDDGLATGATMRAAVLSVKRRNPARVVVAVPVGAARTCAELRAVADEVVCPWPVEDLVAIGFYYDRFEPVEDAVVERLLAEARGRRASASASC